MFCIHCMHVCIYSCTHTIHASYLMQGMVTYYGLEQQLVADINACQTIQVHECFAYNVCMHVFVCVHTYIHIYTLCKARSLIMDWKNDLSLMLNSLPRMYRKTCTQHNVMFWHILFQMIVNSFPRMYRKTCTQHNIFGI
jgi:hypothetical protein